MILELMKMDGQSLVKYFKWVNEFEANHPVYGKVWGDFENTVYADSESGYQHFIQHHPSEEWDYGDI